MTQMKPNLPRPRSVVLLVYDGCQASAVAFMVEALRIANLQAARGEPSGTSLFQWKVIAPAGRPTRAMGDLSVTPAGTLC